MASAVLPCPLPPMHSVSCANSKDNSKAVTPASAKELGVAAIRWTQTAKLTLRSWAEVTVKHLAAPPPPRPGDAVGPSAEPRPRALRAPRSPPPARPPRSLHALPAPQLQPAPQLPVADAGGPPAPGPGRGDPTASRDPLSLHPSERAQGSCKAGGAGGPGHCIGTEAVILSRRPQVSSCHDKEPSSLGMSTFLFVLFCLILLTTRVRSVWRGCPRLA